MYGISDQRCGNRGQKCGIRDNQGTNSAFFQNQGSNLSDALIILVHVVKDIYRFKKTGESLNGLIPRAHVLLLKILPHNTVTHLGYHPVCVPKKQQIES